MEELVEKIQRRFQIKNLAVGYQNQFISRGDLATYNIGSITKVFTAALLQLAIQQGSLSLNDTLDRYFPSLTSYNRYITLGSLVTHTSGLPTDLPGRLDTQALLLAALDRWTPLPSRGINYIYSNVGFILLRYCLMTLWNQDYDSLVKTYLFEPLRMTNSSLDYTILGKYGGGSIRASPADMSAFLIAQLDSRHLMYPVFQACRQVLVVTDNGHYMGMAWEYNPRFHSWNKNGQVAGFSSGIVLCQGYGAYVLADRTDIPTIRLTQRICQVLRT